MPPNTKPMTKPMTNLCLYCSPCNYKDMQIEREEGIRLASEAAYPPPLERQKESDEHGLLP